MSSTLLFAILQPYCNCSEFKIVWPSCHSSHRLSLIVAMLLPLMPPFPSPPSTGLTTSPKCCLKRAELHSGPGTSSLPFFSRNMNTTFFFVHLCDLHHLFLILAQFHQQVVCNAVLRVVRQWHATGNWSYSIAWIYNTQYCAPPRANFCVQWIHTRV